MTEGAASGLARVARGFALLPWHLGAVFTEAKSFKRNPVIGSRWLNAVGLHLARVVVAHAVTRLRWWMLSPLLPRHLRVRFHRDGILVLEDVLPAPCFAAMQEEIRGLDAEVWECRRGDTLTHQVLIDRHVLRQCPVLEAVLFGEPLARIFKYCAAKNGFPLFYLQGIKNGYCTGADDAQKTLHADTFHPTVKGWLFLRDVQADEGAFRYVPGSHRLTWRRLRWEYRRSLAPERRLDGHSEHGSPRVGPEDAASLALPAARTYAVRANTLIVANTFGFHCRGPSVRRSARFEIWALGRPNPFNPFPGFGSRVLHAALNRLVRARLTVLEARARRAGGEAFYHRVPIARFFE